MDFKHRTISEIKIALHKASAEEIGELLLILEKDTRVGVRKLVDYYRREITKKERVEDALSELTKYERKLYDQDFNLVAGVDEAGRGALAGPLVAAAVILPKKAMLYGLKDSKLLSPEQREVLYDRIIDVAISWKTFQVENTEIDARGIQWANLYALEQAVYGLDPCPDFVLSDAFTIRSLNIPNLAIIKGDNLSLSIAAASVLAKVTRDRIMCKHHNTYPQYGFDQHKGYGTLIHVQALKEHGVLPIHRRYFAPVAEYEQLRF